MTIAGAVFGWMILRGAKNNDCPDIVLHNRIIEMAEGRMICTKYILPLKKYIKNLANLFFLCILIYNTS